MDRGTTTVLADGRRVAHSSLGPPDGRPVVYVHGALGTRLDGCAPLLRALDAAHVRLVVPARPGYGGSCPAPGRSLVSWAGDLLAVADALRLDRFALLGVSAGGPYAAVAAATAGARVTATTVVSGTVPLLGPDAPRRGWTARERGARALTRPPARRTLRGTAAAIAADLTVALGPWPVKAGAGGAVRWWHGADDTTIPLAHARPHLERRGGVSLTVLPGEGHLFLRRRIDAILAGLLADAA